MKLGTVTGNVRMQKCVNSMEGEKLLLVEVETQTLAAADKTGAEPGDRVLLVMGQAAVYHSMQAPVDAVVLAVVQE